MVSLHYHSLVLNVLDACLWSGKTSRENIVPWTQFLKVVSLLVFLKEQFAPIIYFSNACEIVLWLPSKYYPFKTALGLQFKDGKLEKSYHNHVIICEVGYY